MYAWDSRIDLYGIYICEFNVGKMGSRRLNDLIG